MITLLEQIVCTLEKLAALIVNGVVGMVNGMIVGVGALLSVVLLLLPEMPEPPASPTSGVLQWINYVVPLAPLAAVVATLGGLFAGYLLVRTALNWLRAL
ncbi:MAG: hypothetical protein WD810_03410 [Solirubrobacterales bacterium]